MPVSTQVQAMRRFREKETEVKSTIDNSIIGGITFDTLASLDLTQLEILKGHIINVISLQKRRVKIGSDVAYVPCSKPVEAEPETMKAVEPIEQVESIESIKPVEPVEHIPDIEESPKIELKQPDTTLFHKSIEELVDIVRTKESEFKTTYAYEVADKIRAKVKKAAFTDEANAAHQYLSIFMNALLMTKFNELGGDDKYRRVKMSWADANQLRADYITDVTMFKKPDKPEKVEKKPRAPRATKKKESESESQTPNKIDVLHSYLYEVEHKFMLEFESKLSDLAKTKAHSDIDRIMTDIDTIRVTFEDKWEANNDVHQNLKARVYDFGNMLRAHIESL